VRRNNSKRAEDVSANDMAAFLLWARDDPHPDCPNPACGDLATFFLEQSRRGVSVGTRREPRGEVPIEIGSRLDALEVEMLLERRQDLVAGVNGVPVAMVCDPVLEWIAGEERFLVERKQPFRSESHFVHGKPLDGGSVGPVECEVLDYEDSPGLEQYSRASNCCGQWLHMVERAGEDQSVERRVLIDEKIRLYRFDTTSSRSSHRLLRVIESYDRKPARGKLDGERAVSRTHFEHSEGRVGQSFENETQSLCDRNRRNVYASEW
jgi:hypothetical protein